MALSVVPDVFQPLTDMDILFVTVFFGANDALQKGSEERGYTNTKSDLRHVPLEKFGDNTSKIVQLIRQHCSKSKTEALPIILLTPPPVHREKFEEYSRAEFGELRSLRNNDAARAYGNKVKEVANELGCHVVDVFSLLGGDGDERDYEQYLADGLHLTEKGNALVYEGLTALIEEELPHLAPKDGETGVPLEGKSWQELC
jgi:lysophospholipase L1-like esterase